ncbi:N-terminal asparagine amidohydrolase-like protein [Venturia nashicola]|nr:N-terminal asparagine amidohydrolase-like protein [Venturia nashicola]
MKIACLQFAPQLGKVQANMEKANKILEETNDLRPTADGRPLWLVLPEMAFSGYNFQTLEEITPCLEPSCAGPSTQWAVNIARHYSIFVTVGYPEVAKPADSADPTSKSVNYNSTVTVSPQGVVIGSYRKRFLYYTDETWAHEGDGKTASGFFAGPLGPLGDVSMGICMDINPHKFLASWSAYEFANHVIDSGTPLVVLSMAWLTRLTTQELAELPLRPDEETFAYWMQRFQPLIEGKKGPIAVVCANRCGIEGNACYAGTSSVFVVDKGNVNIYDVMGKLEEKCMVVDLMRAPKYALQRSTV